MIQYPKISIVTPSYNDAGYLEETIRSVLGQAYPNLEYIIIDGGSTDGSVEIIKKYSSSLHYWCSEKDEGMYHAIQKGFEKSTGEIMAWINSDDRLHAGSLSIAAQIFQDFPQISWIQGHPNSCDEQGRVIALFSWPELSKLYFYKNTRNKKRYIQQESTMWRRALWEKAGSFISMNYKFAGDFELWTRFFQHDKLYNIKALLGSFRVSRSGQASFENFQDYISETYDILQKYPLTKPDIKTLTRIQRIERVERVIMRALHKLKNMLAASDSSVVNEKVYFDPKDQRFKIR